MKNNTILIFQRTFCTNCVKNLFFENKKFNVLNEEALRNVADTADVLLGEIFLVRHICEKNSATNYDFSVMSNPIYNFIQLLYPHRTLS